MFTCLSSKTSRSSSKYCHIFDSDAACFRFQKNTGILAISATALPLTSRELVSQIADCSRSQIYNIFFIFEVNKTFPVNYLPIYWKCQTFLAFLTLCLQGNFSCFFCHLLIFLFFFLPKNYSRNTIRVSNRFDSYQARQNVGPDLDPNCLQFCQA